MWGTFVESEVEAAGDLGDKPEERSAYRKMRIEQLLGEEKEVSGLEEDDKVVTPLPRGRFADPAARFQGTVKRAAHDE